MKKSLRSLWLVAAALFTAGASLAQSAAKDAQLYQAFGEKAGLVSLMDDFMVRLLADPRTGPHFKPANDGQVAVNFGDDEDLLCSRWHRSGQSAAELKCPIRLARRCLATANRPPHDVVTHQRDGNES